MALLRTVGKYLLIPGLLFLYFLLLLFMPIGLYPEGSRLIVQEVTSIVVFFGINFLWLKQKVFFWTKTDYVGLVEKFIVIWPIYWLLISGTTLLVFTPAAHNLNKLLLTAVSALLIGIFEEYLFRGLIIGYLLHNFANQKYWHNLLLLILGAFLFGATHFLNIASQNLLVTIGQVFGAAGLGLLFVAIYVRTKSLWLAIAFHALQDFFALGISQTETSTVDPLGGFITMIVYSSIALVLLRPKKLNALNLRAF